MIPWALPWLEELWSPFHALSYITVRMALAAAVAWLVAVFAGRRLVARLKTVGACENAADSDSQELNRLVLQTGKSATPPMGGVF